MSRIEIENILRSAYKTALRTQLSRPKEIQDELAILAAIDGIVRVYLDEYDYTVDFRSGYKCSQFVLQELRGFPDGELTEYLEENYQIGLEPRVGCVIQYSGEGQEHFGIVVGTNPVLVRSKFGPGPVCDHYKNAVPISYGETVVYWTAIGS